MNQLFAQVALPVPMRSLFDYQVPSSLQCSIALGMRVLVPFGRRKLVGVVLGLSPDTELAAEKIKTLETLLDDACVLSDLTLEWLNWASQYYQHPLGEVIHTALPVSLRKGQPAVRQQKAWQLTDAGRDTEPASLNRSPRQRALLERLASAPQPHALLLQDFTSSLIKKLTEKGLVEETYLEHLPDPDWPARIELADKPKSNLEQSLAVTAIAHGSDRYSCFLLEGVTGSGKTEVYLQAIEPLLAEGKQVLILVPEIGLTPQTVQRFELRFGLPVGVLHSGLTDNERMLVWQQAREGELGIIIGTRSAIFTPLQSPGMIIVDEEHDSSYKQQDGWRYHARDMAVVRARLEGIPLLLGSATPSLESLNNALSGKYQHLSLKSRAGGAQAVRHQLLDLKGQKLEFGLATAMQQRIRQHLQAGHQVMLFINRRGYAPALICHQCGHVEECRRCDRSYTLHRSLNKLQCHHCGDAKTVPPHCTQCGHVGLQPVGLGTEQLEQGLSSLFPGISTVRIDSDSARGKDKLHSLLDEINQGAHQLLIGTQILAKGHHFPNVSLVVILDVDGALYSADYRAAEKLAQLITQVAGRAGRAHIQGELWLQTHHPQHPLLQDLLHNGYQHFARLALQERRFAALPPFSYQALFRSEANEARQAHEFLMQVKGLLAGRQGLTSIGPLPALMEKRQGRYRMQLLLQSEHRTGIQQHLHGLMSQIEKLPLAGKVRWSLDLDPQDFT
ncbi:primosomal protein N' [Bowmanella dokdonensis]|uniref:Replication restart protein PriA n=1 Tax=Bowmanella dokdonensis TaxID=751969 RepID=A0A939IRU7_9ALTE|nr:primosomal protein N' [Bowmanella dokdonensis]MBN7826022.1 primosomal protein N' [Bowmanella dokdonensis]